MTDPDPPFTIREWRLHMTTPARLAGFLGAGLILAIMGPFDTDQVMTGFGRALYWLGVVVVTYSSGYAANTLAPQLSRGRLVPAIALAGGLTGLGAFGFVYVLNGLVFGFWPEGLALVRQIGSVVAIAVIITAVFQLAYATPKTVEAQGVPLLDRLPLEKRGALVSLSVEDHYVRVRTTTGEEMLLLRLSDAIREVGPTTGLRVHRSHWVAFDQISAATRRGDGAQLAMRHGPEIPVSRANVSALKKAGILSG